MRRIRWQYALIALLLCATWPVVAAPLRVVVSIQPLHSLAMALMHGVGEPQLLVRGGASPHDYQMRPSAARALAEADLVFWIGAELESFLRAPLQNAQGKQLAMLQAPGLTLLPMRSGGVWAAADDEHHAHSASHDAHIWLDPLNAIAMSNYMLAALVEADAQHAPLYQANAQRLAERLMRLHQQLSTRLQALQTQRYVVFHDAYQYFERRYQLSAIGALVLEPEQRPGAKRVAQLQAQMRERGVRCVFSEPQFQPALLQTLVAGSTIKTGVLDPLGAELTPSADAYFQLLENLALALETCLGTPPTP